MRCLELILTLAYAGYFVRLATLPRIPAPWPLVLSLLLVALLLTQLVIEGWRLPMLPIYAGAIAAVVEATMPGMRTPGTLLVFAVGALGILAVSVVTALLFQPLDIQMPAGHWPVGVASLPSAPRKPGSGGTENLPAPIQFIWYPGIAPSRTQQLSAFLARRISRKLRASDRVPSTEDLVPAKGKHPVLVYLGGWPQDSLQNRSLICELVSRGFVVVSLQYPQTGNVARPLTFYESDDAFQRSVDLTDERVRIYAKDASAALDQVNEAHAVDLQRVGIFGYSFGGAVAAQATHSDPRFKAAVNIDGRHYAEGRSAGVHIPYMFVGEVLLMPTEQMLRSTDATTRYEARADLIDYTQLAKNLRRNGGIQVIVDGTTHPNFSDDVMRSPLARLSGGGRIDPARALQTSNSLVVAFFETVLLGRTTGWLHDIPREVPETRIEQWMPPGTSTP